eukprot:TRINITY_DN29646_c0_g1_i1.p1 TRINITY_DN29646_c0_g1~~TRINITY_DN29646_c0_g1_i1.p1  ORF type:complete len:119 (+),score=19.01 TRINITY_DN29646_c0_g1_i1:98-454(+)
MPTGAANTRPAGKRPKRCWLLTAVFISLCTPISFCNGWSSRALRPVNIVRAASPGDSQPENQPEPERGAAYYAGMLTSPLKPEDSEKDMLTPTLKFVGFFGVFAAAYLALFLGLNSGS